MPPSRRCCAALLPRLGCSYALLQGLAQVASPFTHAKRALLHSTDALHSLLGPHPPSPVDAVAAQLLAGLGVSLLALLLHASCAPFINFSMNAMSFVSLFSTLVTLFVAFAMQSSSEPPSPSVAAVLLLISSDLETIL